MLAPSTLAYETGCRYPNALAVAIASRIRLARKKHESQESEPQARKGRQGQGRRRSTAAVKACDGRPLPLQEKKGTQPLLTNAGPKRVKAQHKKQKQKQRRESKDAMQLQFSPQVMPAQLGSEHKFKARAR